MPKDARLVFRGKIFDVYQWEQEMFDGTKATFEKLKRPDTVVTIPVTEDGKIILALEEQPGKSPSLGCPGGRLEQDEGPLDGARRELLEETGYDSRDIVLWRAFQPVNKLDWAVYIFIARDCRKVSEQKLDAGEKMELRYLDFDEFLNLASSEDPILEDGLAVEILRAKADPAKMARLREFFKI